MVFNSRTKETKHSGGLETWTRQRCIKRKILCERVQRQTVFVMQFLWLTWRIDVISAHSCDSSRVMKWLQCQAPTNQRVARRWFIWNQGLGARRRIQLVSEDQRWKKYVFHAGQVMQSRIKTLSFCWCSSGHSGPLKLFGDVGDSSLVSGQIFCEEYTRKNDESITSAAKVDKHQRTIDKTNGIKSFKTNGTKISFIRIRIGTTPSSGWTIQTTKYKVLDIK